MNYMSETTVRAAKLGNKSAEALGKMGIGRDDNGYYLLATAGVSIPVPKTGALAALRAIANVGKAAADVTISVLGVRTSQKEIDRRKATCMICFEVDTAGRRLFRYHSFERISCGKPMDPRVAGAKLLRDPVTDGCGCWLQEKWASAEQACPRGKWGPEKTVMTAAQRHTKRRCCGN